MPTLAKRILSIEIERMDDRDPDTSYLGEYSNTKTTEFAIDRAHSLDCASVRPETVEAAMKMQRVADYLLLQEANVGEYDEAFRIVLDCVDKAVECDCGQRTGWSRNEYRYFNPNIVEEFDPASSWLPATLTDPETGEPIPTTEENMEAYWRRTMRQNALKDFFRMEEFNCGNWQYIGIRARAVVELEGLSQRLMSSGLWGIESDSDPSYLKEVEDEQLAELRKILHGFGFSKRQIARAVKDMGR